MVGVGDFAVNRDTRFVKMIIGVLRPQLEGFVAGCLAVSFVGRRAVSLSILIRSCFPYRC